MTTTEQRQALLPLIEQAMRDGARLHHACAQIKVDPSFQTVI